MRVPLVDLSVQHAQVANEIAMGLENLMNTGQFILGPQVSEFEAEFASFMGVEHCIGVGSGTDALEIAIRALGIGPGDKVVIPANTFVASALAVVRAGAEVVVVDVDSNDFLVQPDRLSAALGPDVRAVMPVHLYGQMADMASIRTLDVLIVEDAAQAHGAKRDGLFAGSIGDVAGTSFYPGKNLGAYGDAGAVLSQDPELAQLSRNLRNWGSDKKYDHPVKGFNSRLDSMQAVVLKAKLAHLESWNQQRKQAAKTYFDLLGDVEGVVLPTVHPDSDPVWHLFVVKVSDRDKVLAELHEKEVGAGIHYPTPIHLQGALSDLGHQIGDFPNAEEASQEVLSLPIFPGITEDQLQYVAGALAGAVNG